MMERRNIVTRPRKIIVGLLVIFVLYVFSFTRSGDPSGKKDPRAATPRPIVVELLRTTDERAEEGSLETKKDPLAAAAQGPPAVDLPRTIDKRRVEKPPETKSKPLNSRAVEFGRSLKNATYVPLTQDGTKGIENKVNKWPISCENWPVTYAIYNPLDKLITASLYGQLSKVGLGVVEGVMQQDPIYTKFENDERCPEGCNQVGLTIAHYFIWRDIVKRKLPFALVLEEDVIFHDDICNELPKVVSEMPEAWELAYMGWHPRWLESRERKRVTAGDVMPWTTHAYLVSQEGAQRVFRLLSYFLVQADLSEYVDPEMFANPAVDPGWTQLAQRPTKSFMMPITAPFIKIDFVLLSVYNFFLTDSEQKTWLTLDVSEESRYKVNGVEWDGAADWQGSSTCTERREKLRPGKSWCTCAEWAKRNTECMCTTKDENLLRHDLPMLGGGLAYQHKCKEGDIEHFGRWFDDFPEKKEVCTSADTLSFALQGLIPSGGGTECMPFCADVGKTFSALQLYSHVVPSMGNFDLVHLKAQGVPCRSKGRSDLQCCNIDISIRPPATDLAVVIQILFHLEFKFLIDASSWLPSELHHAVNPENIQYILDAGGNCGMSAVFFANIFPDATIVTVEANPKNFAVLEKNVAAFPNVRAVNMGLWSKLTKLKVIKGNRHGREWDSQVVEAEDSDPDAIDATSIDALLKRFNLPRFDLIKMDIEGSEKEVFEGDTVKEWLPQVRIFLAELHPDMREGSDAAVRAHLRNDKYVEVVQGEYEVYVNKYRVAE
jgi:FkbM family methyltransferase